MLFICDNAITLVVLHVTNDCLIITMIVSRVYDTYFDVKDRVGHILVIRLSTNNNISLSIIVNIKIMHNLIDLHDLCKVCLMYIYLV